MKVGVVGAGAVGAACLMALVLRASVREIVVVDRTAKRAKAVATDIRYGVPLGPRIDITEGDYPDLAGAGLVMITAGVNEKTGGATDRSDPEPGSSCSTPMPKSIARLFPRSCAPRPTPCCWW
jgi:L-lactate dehydrogenase